MTIYEALAFNGKAEDFERYQKLLKKRTQLQRSIAKLTDNIQWEISSLSVFEGELSEKDKELFQKHVTQKREYEKKLAQKDGEYLLVIKQLNELTR